ncbi:hypothetical protein BDF19DRAFT_416515 [Syncephalis fuscata]|nr:hypothetical protein BDF19DRAFT_416515 [Syncephalis fuscata]
MESLAEPSQESNSTNGLESPIASNTLVVGQHSHYSTRILEDTAAASWLTDNALSSPKLFFDKFDSAKAQLLDTVPTPTRPVSSKQSKLELSSAIAARLDAASIDKTINAFSTAVQQATRMAATFAQVADAVKKAAITAADVIHMANKQQEKGMEKVLLNMNIAAATAVSTAIIGITDAIQLATATNTALGVADMLRALAVTSVLNQPLITTDTKRQSATRPSTPLVTLGLDTKALNQDTTTNAHTNSLITDTNTTRSNGVHPTISKNANNTKIHTKDIQNALSNRSQPFRNTLKESTLGERTLSTVNISNLSNTVPIPDTTMLIISPQMQKTNANKHIDGAVIVAVDTIFEELFKLFWTTVPSAFRRQPYPTDRRLRQWTLGDIEQSIGPLHYTTSNLSWSEWCRRFFPRKDDSSEAPNGFRSVFLKNYKLQRKLFSGPRLTQFDQEIRRRFDRLDIVPAMVKNKTMWSKYKTISNDEPIIKLKAIKRPRY